MYHLLYGLTESIRYFIPPSNLTTDLSSKSSVLTTCQNWAFWGLVGAGIVGCFSGVLAMGGKYFSVGEQGFSFLKSYYESILPKIFITWK